MEKDENKSNGVLKAGALKSLRSTAKRNLN